MSVTVRGTDRLIKFFDRFGNWQKFLKVIGAKITKSTNERFEKEQDPEGKKWKPSQRVIMSGGLTLNIHGASGLKGSIMSKVQGLMVAIGTDKNYARTHQLGDEKRHIPQRAFIGLSVSDKNTIRKTLIDFIGGRI